MQLLKRHFGYDRNLDVGVSFRQPVLQDYRSLISETPYCEFILKKIQFSGSIGNLAEFKARITQHIHNATTEALRSVA